MFRQYTYAQLERWTNDVRRQTKHDMARLRLERARTEQHLQSQPPTLAGVQQWWQSARQVLRGGVPALERAILGIVTPHTRAEQLLPDATVPQR